MTVEMRAQARARIRRKNERAAHLPPNDTSGNTNAGDEMDDAKEENGEEIMAPSAPTDQLDTGVCRSSASSSTSRLAPTTAATEPTQIDNVEAKGVADCDNAIADVSTGVARQEPVSVRLVSIAADDDQVPFGPADIPHRDKMCRRVEKKLVFYKGLTFDLSATERLRRWVLSRVAFFTETHQFRVNESDRASADETLDVLEAGVTTYQFMGATFFSAETAVTEGQYAMLSEAYDSYNLMDIYPQMFKVMDQHPEIMSRPGLLADGKPSRGFMSLIRRLAADHKDYAHWTNSRQIFDNTVHYITQQQVLRAIRDRLATPVQADTLDFRITGRTGGVSPPGALSKSGQSGVHWWSRTCTTRRLLWIAGFAFSATVTYYSLRKVGRGWTSLSETVRTGLSSVRAWPTQGRSIAQQTLISPSPSAASPARDRLTSPTTSSCETTSLLSLERMLKYLHGSHSSISRGLTSMRTPTPTLDFIMQTHTRSGYSA
jgi:hypothetical protein